MKKIKNIVQMILLITVMVILSTSVYAKTPSITLTLGGKATTKEIAKGTSLRIITKSGNKTISKSKPKYKSSKKTVATVSSKGLIKAKKVGSTTITVTYKKKTVKLNIKVVIPVKSIKVSPTTYGVSLKGNNTSTKQLKATISPTNATNKTVTWKSSNTNVASVSSSGKVTAKNAGTATITATAGGKTASCIVSVSKQTEYHGPTSVPVTSVKLNKSSASVTLGKTITLTATVAPSNATTKTVAWKSSNDKIASVKNGVVTGQAVGRATITATAGNHSATCVVTVEKIPVTSVTLNKTSASVNKGSSLQLSATVAPSNATYPTVTWKSNNTAVAMVSSSGLVSPIATGSADITATADGKSATCRVTVTDPYMKTIGGVTFNLYGVNNRSMTIFTDKEINESDTQWVINNRNFVQCGDNADFIRYTGHMHERYYGYVPTVKKGVCVEYGSLGGSKTQFCFNVTNPNRAMSFPVAFYYKGTLVVQTTINCEQGYGLTYNMAQDAENYVINTYGINPNTNFQDFLGQCRIYLNQKYAYGQLPCNAGAEVLKQICHDYGYMSRILFPYVENYNKAPFYSESCTILSGHVMIGVYINGQWLDMFDAQGH